MLLPRSCCTLMRAAGHFCQPPKGCIPRKILANEPGCFPGSELTPNFMLQTRREILRVTLNVTQAFEQIFEHMPPGVHGHLLEEVCPLLHFCARASAQSLRAYPGHTAYGICSTLTQLSGCGQALDVDYGGEVIACNLWCLEQEIDTARLRAEALTAFSPIHRCVLPAVCLL